MFSLFRLMLVATVVAVEPALVVLVVFVDLETDSRSFEKLDVAGFADEDVDEDGSWEEDEELGVDGSGVDGEAWGWFGAAGELVGDGLEAFLKKKR